MTIAVYSCYFGRHEPFNSNCLAIETNSRRFIFTDQDDVEKWVAPLDVTVEKIHLASPKLGSRAPKLCPHKFLPENVEWAIYVDNRATLEVPPEKIVEDVESQFGECEPGRYLFAHKSKRDAYKELRTTHARKYIDVEQFVATRKMFRRSKFPRGLPLYVNTMMIQKMGDHLTDALNEDWFELYSTICPRDQPLLPFVIHKHSYKERMIASELTDYVIWPVFNFRERNRFRKAVDANERPNNEQGENLA